MLDFHRALLSLRFYSSYFYKTSSEVFHVRKFFKKVKFADDGTIWVTGTDPTYLSNIIEENLHKLLLNTLKWRMNISIEKTEICLFTRSNLDVDSSSPKVQLNGKDIPYNPHPKILGLDLDESLTFQNHIKKNRTESK